MSKTVEISYYDWLEYVKLEEENKNLKEFNIELNGEYKNSLKQIEEISNKYNELKEENEKLKEDVDFYYKSAKQFREQIEKWEKDFVEGGIVEKD